MTAMSKVSDGRTITVRVPLTIRKRGGRKLVVAPDGRDISGAPVKRHVESAIVKGIARAFRWRDMQESGTHSTIAEIAAAEKINEAYVGRVLRLTLLAPTLIESILTGRHPSALTYAAILQKFYVNWDAQIALFRI